MSYTEKELIKKLAKNSNIKTAEDAQNAIKSLFGGLIQQMLEAEMEDLGLFDLDIPRDREGSFEPQIVKKHQTDISRLESSIIGMYAKGMSTRDIANQVNEMYGMDVSPTLISNITDKIIPSIKEWQCRPLESIYPIVFMDAIHFKVKKDNSIVNKAAYAAIGVNIEGKKDDLGIWIGTSESSKYWLLVLNELKNRGVKDILIACIDGLNGFKEAIKAVYPNTEVQRCIIHQIRNSSRYLSYKDIKEFNADLKLVYTAVNEDAALQALSSLEEKWGDKYLLAIKSWRNNWEELSTFFKYPPEIRRIIYTTNAIEGYNRQLRKVTKTKTAFPTDEALLKILYLATIDITKKWVQSIRGWSQILAQLSIYFDERLDDHLY